MQRTVTAGCLVIKFTENRDKVLAREEDLRTIKQLQINTSLKNKLSQQSLNILVKLPHWLRKKKCYFVKKKWCDSWINHINESQSDYKDHKWFQNGCNTSFELIRMCGLSSTYIVEEAKLVSSCFNFPSSAKPLLSLHNKKKIRNQH